MYMDDIKLYAGTENQLKEMLGLVRTFSADICMAFGLEKCKTLSVVRGQVVAQMVDEDLESAFAAMGPSDVYKYLGFCQARQIDQKNVKRKMKDTYLTRLRRLLKTQLNGNNMFKAINTYAIPVLTYSFGVVCWTATDLEDLMRSTRVLLTKFRAHHPKACMERLILPRKKGGRGLIDIKWACERQIGSMKTYFMEKEGGLYAVVRKADKGYTPLNLSELPTADFKTNRQHESEILEQWKSKQLHGRHAFALSQPGVDEEASNAWLWHRDLFIETEGFLVAIQDQVIATKNYQRHIMKLPINDDSCRRCGLASETIQHIMSACQSLAATDYLKRHNAVAGILHQDLALKYQIINKKLPYYLYKPSPVLENETHKLYWDRSVLTDRTVAHNRPDIILMDKVAKETTLIDVGIPCCHNLDQYYNEKVSKYLPLVAEIKDVWMQEKVTIVPVIISTVGVVTRKVSANLCQMGISKSAKYAMEKAVVLSTASIVCPTSDWWVMVGSKEPRSEEQHSNCHQTERYSRSKFATTVPAFPSQTPLAGKPGHLYELAGRQTPHRAPHSHARPRPSS
ncbi:uncharacterized protein LOC111058333 [Nilaparvata lugens]|uniref:uncharacterized protein LOC111058333 n=1 Tax=Nilaparvata lugens TaxID=108931 RepID=UPI00193D32AF|nr:uncharacterized protein LOC111058333 [Nilaparvata lugens]